MVDKSLERFNSYIISLIQIIDMNRFQGLRGGRT